ncbi:MAG: hypothetical protein RMJ43_10925 [Chloroherpetonaceae bacterium]|nr:hypothetical protein [Chthonomonadaceae bacterium]MDW8208341.1 hypothetical protein [Chloroherpetonaceae bacterium]
MHVRTIFRLWLPLAVSFELMMLEGPAVQAAIGVLPDPALHLAAWGLTMSLSLLIESPVIMLLSTAIALVRGQQSFRVLQRFTFLLSAACTALTALVAFTPLFDLICRGWMRQPGPIVQAARPAMQIMLFWTAAIAWRRFFQGILIRHGGAHLVSWGTVVRLLAVVLCAYFLTSRGALSGAQVAALTLMVAVTTEAILTLGFVQPALRRDVLPVQDEEGHLTLQAVRAFHAPLAWTTLLTLLAQPLTSAALARLPHPTETLAAWPVTFMALLVIRGPALALQETCVAQARHPQSQPALWRFTVLVGGFSAAFTALVAFTPLLDVYLVRVVSLPELLQPYVRAGVLYSLLLPWLTALGSWARGVLVAGRQTAAVYTGMVCNLLVHTAVLWIGVALQLPGMQVAACAFTIAGWAEYRYLRRCVSRMLAPVEASVATAHGELSFQREVPAEDPSR